MALASLLTWNDVPTATLAGIFSTALWVGVLEARRRLRYRRLGKRLSGEYEVRRKRGAALSDHATIRASGNVLHVNYQAAYLATGRIVLDEQTLARGVGQYEQPTELGPAFGFWEVQVADDSTIFVHTTYEEDRRETLIAYTWNKIEPTAQA